MESDQFIVDESPEICVGEDVSWGNKILKAFPALRSRNYQLYFAGQLISLVGTWLQVVAEGWLVYILTNSAFFVGLDAAMAMLPTLLFSLFGGVIVDRYPKKKILLFTQSGSMILALILGLLTVLKIINVWEVITLSFILGIVNAVDSPARQAYVVELVEDKNILSSAIALNSGMFNAARVIGPTIAGILIAVTGTGMAFILNGISYIAVIIALIFINTPTVIEKHIIDPIKAIKEGVVYTISHPTIRLLLILSGVVSIFGWSYSTLMPVIATQIFHLGATGLGYLYAAGGFGALLGTFLISAFSHKVKPAIYIVGGNFLFIISLLLFTFTSHTLVAAILLFFAGLGLVSQFSMTNSTIQHTVENNMRGRVMSLYTLVFIGFGPFGNLEIGFMAQHFGTDFAIRLNVIIVLIFAVYLWLNRKRIHT